MSRRGRRSTYDAFQPIDAPAWVVVRDRFNQVLKSERLEPQADLRSAFIAEQTRLVRDGWTDEDFSLDCSICYFHRAGERISVSISRNDPSLPGKMDRPPAEPTWPSNVVPLKRN